MHLGDHDEITLDIMGSYAAALYISNKDEEAFEIQSQVLHTREKILGPQNRETLSSKHRLGLFLTGMGNLERAEELFSRSLLEQRQNHLEDPGNELVYRDFLRTTLSLADVFMDQGEHQDALVLLKERLMFLGAWRNKRMGILRWEITAQIAKCLCEMGRYRLAHSYIEVGCIQYREYFDDKHLYDIRLRRQLANLRWAEDQCDEAEELMKHLFRDWLEKDDSDQELCTEVLRDIFKMQYSRGKFEEAEKTCERALEVIVDGRRGEITNTMCDENYFQGAIRKCHEIRGQMEEAKACTLPSEHEFAMDTELASEAQKWIQKGKQFLAATRCEKSVATSTGKSEVHKENPRIEDGDIQEARIELAQSLYRQQRYEDAYELEKDILARKKRTTGWHDHRTQICLFDLACTTEKLGKYDQSENLWSQLLHWQRCQFERDQEMVFHAYNAVAGLMKQRADFKGAEEACKSALAITRAFLNDVKPGIIIDTAYILGCALRDQEKFEEAEAAFSQAYECGVAIYGSYDTNSIGDLICLTEVAESAGNSDRIPELYYLLGTTIALPSEGREEDFDESASESDGDSVTMALHSDGEKEGIDDRTSGSDNESNSSDWETTDSDSCHNEE
ncbi:MAG: hypothetical protein Q9195_008291 [Heterodermia aff. obscurata]